MFKLNRSERGQSIIVIALIMVVLIALIALVIDIGWAYAQRRNCQNAADAAALAGTLEYVRMLTWDPPRTQGRPPSHSSVRREATNYVLSQGLLQTDILYIDYVWADGHRSPVPEGAGRYTKGSGDLPTGVQVMVGKNFNTFFAGVIGHRFLQASAVARDVVEWGISEADKIPLLPIAVDDDLLKYDPNDKKFHPEWPEIKPIFGQDYCLWQGPQVDAADITGNCPTGSVALPPPEKEGAGGGAVHTTSGNWGWLTWDRDLDMSNPKKEGSLAYDIINGHEGPWWEGMPIPGNTGIMAAAEKHLLERVGDEVILPIYDTVTGPGANARYHTIKLAVFEISGVVLGANKGFISGKFVREYNIVTGGSPSGDDTGLLWIRSIRPVP